MASETAPAPESNSSNSPPPPSSSSGSSSASLSQSPTPPASPPPSPHSPPPSASPPPPPHSPPPSSSTAPPPSSSTPPPSSSSPPPSSPASPPPPASSSPSPKSSPSEPPPPNSPPGKGHPSPPPPNGSPAPPPPATSATPPPPTGTLSPPATPEGNSFVPPPSSVTLSPPPPKGLTPPSSMSPPASGTSQKSPSQTNSTSGGSGGSEVPSSSYQTAIIIGATVGGIIILALLILLVILCVRRKKRKEYYMYPAPPPHHGPTGEYFKAGVSDWNRPQPGDHVVKLTPPPGAMGTPQGGGGWGAPPVANTSSEFSSAYSGGPANNNPGGNNNNNNHVPMPPLSPNMGLGHNQSNFTYDELAAATGGFSQANLLGQGGFGYVHKGVLPSGKVVAVKSLKTGSGQGEREFQAEVEIISRVHHRHLVSLVGYCIADGQRMLVYEFVSNKTLEFHLHGKGQPTMDWATRLRIALGSAKGLAYLHEDCHPRIIHRDIKAANILLDDNFEAMVADFGLAKLSSDNYTHVSTRVMGTFGYLAPEYASSGKLTEKSDVFSFGVMLLELITGRRPVDVSSKFMEDSLVDWARPLLGKALEDGNYSELVDPRLENNFVPQEMARLVSCAAASIRHSARRRPKMSQIVRALEGDSSLDDLNEGIKPGQSSAYGTSGGSNAAAAYDTRAYNADMMKFRKMVMSSQDFGSSEYGVTSEYGLNPSTSSSDSPETDSWLQMHNP